MSAQPTRFAIEITLIAPMLTKASGAIGFGLDAATLRDPLRRPALPGTLVKGNLRQSWAELAWIAGSPTQEFIAEWLGKRSDASGGFDKPSRGRLSFEPWWSDLDWGNQGSRRRYRIQVDAKTGAVKHGALQVIESPYAAGERVMFSGAVSARVDDAERDALAHWLRKGVQLIPALGALKGNGFGRVEGVRVTAEPIQAGIRSLGAGARASTRVGLRVRPATPFCFARLAPGSRNHFESEDFIPGGALVAAIARRLAEQPGRWPQLQAELDRLHISHARAVVSNASERPLVAPLSLAKANGRFLDLSGQAEPKLVDGQAPLFAVDWKDADHERAARALAGAAQAAPAKRLRLRNEIDTASGTAAEGILYSIETVLPDGCDWLANLELSAAANPSACLDQLADLLTEPLTHLGKTKATADSVIEAAYPLSVPCAVPAGESVIVVLQTPARLLPDDLALPPTNGVRALHAAYAGAWRTLSDGALTLSHCYAAQGLQGGGYWWNRFRRPDPAGVGAYRPQLFSAAGSVFCLRMTDPQKASALLELWGRRGLPQLDNAPGGERWRYNPWIAANGYGEIAVNPDIDGVLRGAQS